MEKGSGWTQKGGKSRSVNPRQGSKLVESIPVVVLHQKMFRESS